MPVLHYSATITDGQGSKKVVEAYSNPADYTGEPAGFNAWIAALDAIISGVISAGQIRLSPSLPTVGTTGRSGFADSRVAEMVEFRFNVSGTQKHWTQAVPAFNDTFLSGNKSPNLAATTVAAYTALMTSGPFREAMGVATLTTLNGAFPGSRKVKGLRARGFVTPS